MINLPAFLELLEDPKYLSISSQNAGGTLVIHEDVI